jgi:hypothetical protein
MHLSIGESSQPVYHANPGITMKVYAHVVDGTSGMAADGMDEALGWPSDAL